MDNKKESGAEEEGAEGPDSCPNELPYVGEGCELLAHINVLSIRHDEGAYHQTLSILEAYQEQGELLDVILPSLMQTIMIGVRRILSETRTGVLTGERDGVKVWRVVYYLMKVRGWKVVRRLMGCEVEDLILVVDVLYEGDTNKWSWEVLYGVWVWLSGLVLVPFCLDSVLSGDKLDKTVSVAEKGLERIGKPKDGAAAFLSRLLTRQDMQERLDTFINEGQKDVRYNRKRRTGFLRTLVWVFKVGRRSDTKKHVPVLSSLCSDLLVSSERKMCVNENERWLALKLLSKLTLSHLPPKLASWRYSRGSRVLFNNSGVAQGTSMTYQAIGYLGKEPQSAALTTSEQKQEATQTASSEDPYSGSEWLDESVQQMVESAMDIFFEHMHNPSTKIRWTSAKAIGRITTRLPREFASEIVEAIFMTLLDTTLIRSHASWHGGLLTLAELARHGAILPQGKQLGSFVEFATRAAKFDVRVREHSMGTNVRDAACYAFWAMARAYAPEVVSPFATKISKCLLPLSLLDREVGCRRAAAAAYQECVGRTDTFAHGISIVGIVNFFSVSNRKKCYGAILHTIAAIGDGMFKEVMVVELRDHKVSHWDITIRELASEALARISDASEKQVLSLHFAEKAKRKHTDPVVQHGAVLTLANLIRCSIVNETVQNRARELLTAMHTDGYFNRSGGDNLRCAACELVSACAIAGIYEGHLPYAQSSFSLLALALSIGDEKARESSCRAISALCKHVISKDRKWACNIRERFMKVLTNDNLSVEHRRGYAAAYAALGDDITDDDLLSHLVRNANRDADAEVRKNAISSLGILVSRKKPSASLLLSALRAACEGMRDWQVNNRGDVGSWVRKEGLLATVKIIQVAEFQQTDIEQKLISLALHLMIRLRYERIDEIRGIANDALISVLTISGLSEGLKRMTYADGLLHALDPPTDTDGYDDNDCRFDFPYGPLFARIYWKSAFWGLCSSAGGRGYQARRAMRQVLNFLKRCNEENQLAILKFMVVQLDESVKMEEHMVIPALRVLERSLMVGCFKNIDEQLGMSIVKVVKGRWTSKRKDVVRLGVAGRVLCQLAAQGDKLLTTRRSALKAVGILLCGPLPIVRRMAAEALYFLLVGDMSINEGSKESGSAVEKAMDLVARTNWQASPIKLLKSARNSIWSLLKVV